MADPAKNMVNREQAATHNSHMDERLKKVFIIEDNEMHSMMMDFILSKENSFNIFRFKSGEECIKKMHLKPDIVILDYGLPGISGLETFSKIKEIKPDVPIVVVTGNTTDTVAQKFREMGAYEYIVKEPESFHRLNSVIESILLRFSEKQYATNNRTTMMIVGGFILVIIISCIISYLILKH